MYYFALNSADLLNSTCGGRPNTVCRFSVSLFHSNTEILEKTRYGLKSVVIRIIQKSRRIQLFWLQTPQTCIHSTKDRFERAKGARGAILGAAGALRVRLEPNFRAYKNKNVKKRKCLNELRLHSNFVRKTKITYSRSVRSFKAIDG